MPGTINAPINPPRDLVIRIVATTTAIASVQNLYNLGNRQSEEVLEYCTKNELGFIPWFPLDAGKFAKPGGKLDKAAKAHGASVSQLALAWLLQKSPVVLPIPGTSDVNHLKENVGGASLKLTESEWALITESGGKR